MTMIEKLGMVSDLLVQAGGDRILSPEDLAMVSLVRRVNGARAEAQLEPVEARRIAEKASPALKAAAALSYLLFEAGGGRILSDEDIAMITTAWKTFAAAADDIALPADARRVAEDAHAVFARAKELPYELTAETYAPLVSARAAFGVRVQDETLSREAREVARSAHDALAVLEKSATGRDLPPDVRERIDGRKQTVPEKLSQAVPAAPAPAAPVAHATGERRIVRGAYRGDELHVVWNDGDKRAPLSFGKPARGPDPEEQRDRFRKVWTEKRWIRLGRGTKHKNALDNMKRWWEKRAPGLFDALFESGPYGLRIHPYIKRV